MGASTTGKTGLLTRLARDRAGNTLAITAAAIVPLIALIGGGVDISRIYLTKTRLQQACDAGALAGRKSMSGITWTNANMGTANDFFHTNFPDGKFGAGTPSISYTASNTGAVTGTATINVPMTLMGVFKAGDKTLTANCTADLQLPNTDVMFVLDTTLSMNDVNPGDTQSKIVSLRNSVQSFYTQLQQVKPAGSQIRYGFVPYSSTVNVGMLLKRDWLQDNPEYDSRVADGIEMGPGGTQSAELQTNSTNKISGSKQDGTPFTGSSENCVAPPNNMSVDKYTNWTAWDPSGSAQPRSRWRDHTMTGTKYSASLNGNNVCVITPTVYDNYVERETQTIDKNPNAGKANADVKYYHWIYQRVKYPMTNIKGSGDGNQPPTGGKFDAFLNNNQSSRAISWTAANACIEERATRRTNEHSSIPRYDMDIDLVPDKTKPETQWKPWLPGVIWGRRASGATSTTGWEYGGNDAVYTRKINIYQSINYYSPSGNTQGYAACPSAARPLREIDQSTIQSYLAGLKPDGFTYHDIGMLWGLRLMSRDGLFAAENRAAEATGKVARHLIFMTDGATDTRIGAYDAWGVSAVTRLRTPTNALPTNAQQNTITEDRLSELCNVAKNDKNITVWVIAFGTSLTSLLSNCASPNRAYEAKNAAELNATFSQIASQIAQLRITR